MTSRQTNPAVPHSSRLKAAVSPFHGLNPTAALQTIENTMLTYTPIKGTDKDWCLKQAVTSVSSGELKSLRLATSVREVAHFALLKALGVPFCEESLDSKVHSAFRAAGVELTDEVRQPLLTAINEAAASFVKNSRTEGHAR